jgi:hypothetical protein
MCGHVFDSDDDDATDADEPTKAKSRVRQRTISVSRDDLGEIAQAEDTSQVAGNEPELEARGEDSFAFTDKFSPSSTPDKQAPELFEIDRAGEAEPTSNLFEESSAVDADDTREFREAAVEDDPESTIFGAPLFGEVDSDDAETESGEDDDSLDESADSANENEEDGSDEPKRKRRRRRRRKKRSSADEGSEESAEQVAEPSTAPDEYAGDTTDSEVDSSIAMEPEAVAEIQAEAPDLSLSEISTEMPVKDETRKINREQIVEQSKVEETIFKGKENMETQEAVNQHGNAGHRNSSSAESKMEQAADGALVGWLVTYGPDGKGTSIELRGGKFFIGRQKLRENDMVIGDSALSTPHCLVVAEPGSSLQIQDLMSEQGTFIKKQGAQNFIKVEDLVAIGHGDTLRFGAYELLVCLVP